MEKDVFAEKITSNMQTMYRIAYTLLQNNADCEDALQQTILKAWEKLDTLREPERFRSFLLSILVHVCRDMQRRNRRTLLSEDVTERIYPADTPDPILHMALHSLPIQLRLPFAMYAVENMTMKEIALALKLPQTTVRGRIERAKKYLQKELTDNEPYRL